jgi:hypothetical protein
MRIVYEVDICYNIVKAFVCYCAGKTIQTIALIAYLIETKRNDGPYLITVPLSTMSNWANEFIRWAPAITVVQYRGTPVQRRDIMRREASTHTTDTHIPIYTFICMYICMYVCVQMAPGRYQVLLITYDYAMKDKSALKKIPWQYIIIDEGHRLKNARCKFTQILGQEYVSKHRLLLTGTPLQNNLPELWSLLNFLLPKVFNSVDSFEQWFSKPFATFRGPNRSTQVQESQGAAALTTEERLLVINRLHQVLRPFLLRRVKSQVLTQLPDKVERVIRCELSAWQRAFYQQLQRYGAVAQPSGSSVSGSGGLSSANMKGLSGTLVQLRKACNHPYMFLDSYNIDDNIWKTSGKFELLDRILPKLRATHHRVLVFSQMTSLMDILESFLHYRGYPYLRLDGSTPAFEREARMKLFNAPDSPYFLFLLSTRAGGLGINLASADTVILFDSDWNPTADAQAQDRAHRIGQTREVRVFRLITATPLEERILERAQDKASMEALVIEAGQFSTTEGNMTPSNDSGNDRKKLLEDILSAELEGAKAADEEDDGIPDDDELNEIIARDDAEVEQFTRMDASRYVEEAGEYEQSCNTSGEKTRYSRLTTDAQLPSWVTVVPETAMAAIAAKTIFTGKEKDSEWRKFSEGETPSNISGKKRRRRSEVAGNILDMDSPEAHVSGGKVMRSRKTARVYFNDLLTDEQFMKLAEEKGGDMEAIQAAIQEQHRLQEASHATSSTATPRTSPRDEVMDVEYIMEDEERAVEYQRSLGKATGSIQTSNTSTVVIVPNLPLSELLAPRRGRRPKWWAAAVAAARAREEKTTPAVAYDAPQSTNGALDPSSDAIPDAYKGGEDWSDAFRGGEEEGNDATARDA